MTSIEHSTEHSPRQHAAGETADAAFGDAGETARVTRVTPVASSTPPHREWLTRAAGYAGWTLFALVVLQFVWTALSSYLSGDFVEMAARMEAQPAHATWYGNWDAVAFSVLFFSAVVLAFLRSPRRREWRHLGLSQAYLLALFTEMYGLPLTIYLLGSTLGVQLGFGFLQGHLWATLLDRLGLMPLAEGVALVMAVSNALIVVALALMAAGWWQTWRARGELVTTGLYRFVRHPQYFGFLLLITAFFIQWPTLPTVVLFPVLVVTYYRLARREEREMAQRFGERWTAYLERTPMLVPGWPKRATGPSDATHATALGHTAGIGTGVKDGLTTTFGSNRTMRAMHTANTANTANTAKHDLHNQGNQR